jgi:drug/metabolite transporter (DMT)-like permease
MGLHWITYFYSLQLSNVAIGMLSLFTYPVMTSLLEPVFLKTQFSKMHLLLGVLVLIGIYFLAPSFDTENDYFLAILIGLL